jgi:hypothetical protein
MQAKPEFRRSERFRHESIVKLEDDLTLSPYYAVSYNLSEAGMYFKSLFEMYPGAHILMRIDDFGVSHDPVPARVAWCRELEDTAVFRFGVGVEFLPPEKNQPEGIHPDCPAHEDPRCESGWGRGQNAEAPAGIGKDRPWHPISG